MALNKYLILGLAAVILPTIQFIFLKTCKEFQSKNKWIYLLSIIIPIILLFYSRDLRWYDIFLSASYMILINLSISDVLYREIDPIAYNFLIIFALINICVIAFPLSNLLSLIITYISMYLYYKLGVKFKENTGGADIKIFLILSCYYPFDFVFMFLIFSFFFTLILALFYAIKNRRLKTSTPMIISITMGHIFISFIYLMLEKNLYCL